MTVSGLTLLGDDAAKYTLTQPTTNADITAASLTVTGITASDKVYDGTTSATLDTSSATLAGAIIGDDVTLDLTGMTAAFADSNAGPGKTVQASGLALSGADRGNYTLTQPAATASITPADAVVAWPTASAITYGQTLADSTLSGGSATPAGSFAFTTPLTAPKAGMALQSVTYTPADTANYNPAGSTASVTVNHKGLTVTGITANDKVYDGTQTATLNTAGAALLGLVPLDAVNLDTAGATGAFADPNVGPGKTVQVSGLTLSGKDAGNYTLAQPDTTANITQAGLTVTGIEAQGKVYDGTNSATLIVSNAVLVGVLSGDTVTLNTTNAVGSFADKIIGTGKLVTLSGLTLLGDDAAKYTLTQPTTNADITAASLTVKGIIASDKVYDGTTSATLDTSSAALAGVIIGDDVTLDLTGVTAAFADGNAGPGKTVQVSGVALSGADRGNYTLTQPAATASITPADAVVAWPTASAITYGQTLANSTLSGGSATPTGSFAFTAPLTAPKAGTAPQSVTFTPADTANYKPATGSVSVMVDQAALSVSAGNFSRTYGADNPNFTGILAGVLAGDNITAAYSTEAKAASPAGNYSIVPALSDPDNRLSNYHLTVNNGILTITPASTTVALGTSQNPIVQGSSISLAATVSPVAPAATTPTGSVQFYANGQPLGAPVALAAGAATLDTAQLSAGSNTLSAVYLGDANFLASSDSYIQAVQMDIQTVTILSIVPNRDGKATVTCQGVPDTQYLVQATPALNAPITWETVATNTSGYIDGRWTYVDDMTQHPQRFFRAALP